MQNLSFFDPIYDHRPKFTAASAFDSYFTFSKTRYRILETHKIIDDKVTYRVERYQVKLNIPLEILKVLSFSTVMIPLIMGIGKLTSRKQRNFVIEKILPPSEIAVEAKRQVYQDFKNQALTKLSGKEDQLPLLDWSLTEEQKDDLANLLANQNRYQEDLPQGTKIIRGGTNKVLFLDSIPGFVFKPMFSKEDAKKYIQETEPLRQFIQDNNLFLLKIPQAEIIKIGTEYLIMQEKADLIATSYGDQKGFYTFCWQDQEMQEYMKLIFTQLAEFIVHVGFADVKYDNIPFTTQGEVALVDLDTDSPLLGLTSGCAQTNDGLLNYIPLEHLTLFADQSLAKIKEEFLDKLKLKIAEIQERAQRKIAKSQAYTEYTQRNFLTVSSQIINPALPKLFKDSKKQKLAEFMIKELNHQLARSTNLSLKEGRRTVISYNTHSPLFKKARKLWLIPSKRGLLHKLDHSIIRKVLQKLQEKEYIYQYKIKQDYTCAEIVC